MELRCADVMMICAYLQQAAQPDDLWCDSDSAEVKQSASFVSRRFSRRPFYHLAARHFRREAQKSETH